MKRLTRGAIILAVAYAVLSTQPALAEEKFPADVGWLRYIYPELTRSPGAFETKPTYFTKNFTLIFSEFKKYWKRNPEVKTVGKLGWIGSRYATKFLYESFLENFPNEKDMNRVPSSFFLESNSAVPYIHRYDLPLDSIMISDIEYGESFTPLKDLAKSFVGSFKSYKDALKSGNKKKIARAMRLLKKKIGSKSVAKVKKLYTSKSENKSN